MRIRESGSAVIYTRVSTDEQARDAYGLDSQHKACLELCEKRGWAVLGEYSDAGVSAWADVESPSFNDMIDRIVCDGSAAPNIVFSDYSRFGRKTLPALAAFEKLDKLGVLSIAADKPQIDCRTAAGRTARREELSKAEDFSDQHSEKTSARMKIAYEDGRWCRPAPLGYQSIGARAKVKGQPNIVPLESEASLIVKAFELVHLGNDRPAEVLRKMTAMGLRSKKGNKLSASVFLKILRNPVYIGLMRSKKWGDTGGLHEGIIDAHTFRNVQLILKGKKPIAAPYQRNREDFPLRRFLRCSECSHPLTGGPSKSSTGKTYDYYHCFRCRAVKSVPTSKAATEFLELLERLRVGPLFTMEFAAVLKEEWMRITGDSNTNVQKLRRDLKERRAAQMKLVTKYLQDDPNIMPIYSQMNGKFEEEIAAIEAQIVEATMVTNIFEQLLKFSKSLLVDIPSAWARASLDQKQRVQNILFPSGLKYHPQQGILNSDNDCLFSRLESFLGGKISMVRPRRFELLTYSFGGCRSIQLSYGRAPSA